MHNTLYQRLLGMDQRQFEEITLRSKNRCQCSSSMIFKDQHVIVRIRSVYLRKQLAVEVNVLFLNFSFLLSSAVIFAQDFVFVFILKTEKQIWRERRTAGPAALHAVVVRRGRAGKNTEN